jgi:heavy metal translocating P-type ATPase
MLKKVWRFFNDYRQFGLAVIAILAGLALDLSGKDTAAHFVLGVAAIANAIPIIKDILQDLRAGKYGVDILAATAIITAVIMGEYWAGMIIVLMLTGGEALEDYAAGRAKTELTALLERAPRTAHVLRGRKTVDIPAKDVKPNDKIIIRAGELVPVDAVVIEGQASFDESSLTGESVPALKKPNDQLLSGSVNQDGVVTARALRSAADSQYEQIVTLVKAAASSRAPFVRLADRYSIPFTIVSFGIAIAAWVISGESIRFLEVIVVATPCPLILAAPIAIISGMSRQARRGIIVKNGGALERLAEIKTFAFDKTGTLTHGQLELSSIKTVKPFTKDEVLTLAASLEQNSNHIVAGAIVEQARAKKLKLAKIKSIEEVPGMGLRGVFGKYRVVIGRRELVEQEGMSVPKSLAAPTEKTAVYIAVEQAVAGMITFDDRLREKSKFTLESLRRMGVKNFLMVTGDNRTVANKVAGQLGINKVIAAALPVDKIRAVEEEKNRPVAFVGDGVNDAPVLAASDLGIALGARGAAAAAESADAVIMVDDIERVSVAVAISKKTLQIAKQSIWIGIAISVGLMLVFSTGRFSATLGAGLQEIVDVIVIFNALRAHGPFGKKKDTQTL